MKLSTLDNILVEQIGNVLIAKINRQDKLNSFSPRVLEEFNQVLDQTELDKSVKVLVITGAGEKAFVVGNDVTQLKEVDTVGAYEQMVAGQQTFLRIHEYSKPVIAMVNGYALGGGFELALSCDMVIASENAQFGFPEINLNTMPGWGGTQLAVKKMGINRAKEMVLSGKYYSAEECIPFGFVNKLCPLEKLRQETLELANTLANKEAFTLKMAKDALNRGEELDIAHGFRYEAQAYAVNFSAPHAKKGFESFLNRKKQR
ncbi:enoyl-CoA hydratase/isomerase family protein [Fictibacillus enclensis]|uniref:enoyl-CoA hydratase/isomerase family protein n=1 Tax=Fictibacillus enclensis TaxID=1017270 RepID=UPI0024BFE923|nr:enoyl-CoA hydratase/isomerase family protein [Fictibacillus enclensis]WHY71972.1 enoyl-CoA hydratase/isomerase family protein [Fictibacillus enclensis]